MERGGYHVLLRLGFEMDISPIQVLAITQNTFKPIKLFSRHRAIDPLNPFSNERYFVSRRCKAMFHPLERASKLATLPTNVDL